jgi:hypothetical protein
MAVAVDGGSLLEAAIAALAALISPRACVTSSGKPPPFCADLVPLYCITLITKWSVRVNQWTPPSEFGVSITRYWNAREFCNPPR